MNKYTNQPKPEYHFETEQGIVDIFSELKNDSNTIKNIWDNKWKNDKEKRN